MALPCLASYHDEDWTGGPAMKAWWKARNQTGCNEDPEPHTTLLPPRGIIRLHWWGSDVDIPIVIKFGRDREAWEPAYPSGFGLPAQDVFPVPRPGYALWADGGGQKGMHGAGGGKGGGGRWCASETGEPRPRTAHRCHQPKMACVVLSGPLV